MSDTTQSTTPSFKGLLWYRQQHFSFFIPNDWHQTNWQDNREGVIFVPKTDDNHTLFAVEVKDLGTEITPDDLPYLSKGFMDGIKQLPEGQIEDKKESVVNKLIELQAKYTFLEDGETRKRWVRVLYRGTRQHTFTAQGKTIEDYDYWLPMFFEAMMTSNIHNEKPDTPSM